LGRYYPTSGDCRLLKTIVFLNYMPEEFDWVNFYQARPDVNFGVSTPMILLNAEVGRNLREVAGNDPGLVLDVGSGRHPNNYLKFGPGTQVFCCDLCPEAMPANNPGAIARGQALPFPDNTFGLVTAKQVIHYQNQGDGDTLLAEMVRVAAPEGTIVVCDAVLEFPNPKNQVLDFDPVGVASQLTSTGQVGAVRIVDFPGGWQTVTNVPILGLFNIPVVEDVKLTGVITSKRSF
jgi:SAM-dependent methyltransferase